MITDEGFAFRPAMAGVCAPLDGDEAASPALYRPSLSATSFVRKIVMLRHRFGATMIIVLSCRDNNQPSSACRPAHAPISTPAPVIWQNDAKDDLLSRRRHVAH